MVYHIEYYILNCIYYIKLNICIVYYMIFHYI